MYKLELNDNFINLYKNDELMYTYDWESLKDIWKYATQDDVEGIYVTYDAGLMSIILTTAEGQGGVVAVVDTRTDKLIHYHYSPFAIKALVAGDKIIILHHVMFFGVMPSYHVSCMKLDNLEMVEADRHLKLPEDPEFNDKNIELTLVGKKLTIDDSCNSMEVDISSIMNVPN